MQPAAIYLSQPQELTDQLISADQQAKACREYSTAHDLEVIAVSQNSPGPRDQFERLLSAASSQPSPFRAMAVWKLHRFSPSLENTVMLRNHLHANNVRLLSTTEKHPGD